MTLLILSAWLAAPAFTQTVTTLPEAASISAQAARAMKLTLFRRHAALAADDAHARLDRLLGLLAEVNAHPRVEAPTLALELVQGLKSGAYKSLILGETHSVLQERAFATALMKHALQGGVKPGSFIREKNTYMGTGFLETAGVPVLEFRNQFSPDPEVEALLQRHRRRPVWAYAGHAHAADKVKDYVQNVLEAGRVFGYGPGLEDMPTIEGSFKKRGLKPAIVAMVAEEGMLNRIEWIFLKQLTAENPELPELREAVEDLIGSWSRRLGEFPAAPATIRFTRHPEQPNLVIGLTFGERRPLALDSALRVLRRPEVEAWLAEQPVKSVESLRYSEGAPTGGVRVGYQVIVHRADGERLARRVPVDPGFAEARLLD